MVSMTPGQRVLFRYSGNLAEAERLGGDPIISRYDHHTAVVVRPLTADESDLDETGPMYLVRFDDGYEGDTFEDELEVVR